MKSLLVFAFAALFAITARAEKTTYSLTPVTNETAVTVVIQFTNNFAIPRGVSTLQGRLGRKWVSLQNFVVTQNIGSVELPLPPGYSTYRLRAMSVVPGNAFPRLALAYGNITTEGGSGPAPTGTNLWLPEYEGAPATNVVFSNPRAAVADEQGRIYVVEQDSHAVSIIETGTVRTAVGTPGTRLGGFIEFDSGVSIPSTILPLLQNPTGLFYQNGTLYILDAGNGRVLRYRDGMVSKLFSLVFGDIAPIANGGSLWVSPDEQEAFYTDGTVLKYWDASEQENGAGGVVTLAQGFVHLSDVKVNPQGRTIVADQGANRVYRVRNNGSFLEDIEAGNGQLRGPSAGDARNVGLAGPTSLAYLPLGGYLISTDAGARVWYVDIDGDAAPLVYGRAPTVKKPGAHAGDGKWFRRGGRSPKVSNIQSVSVAPNGDMILLEGGYVRKIQFLRAKP